MAAIDRLLVDLIDKALVVLANQEILLELHAVEQETLLLVSLLFGGHRTQTISAGHVLAIVLQVADEFLHATLLKQLVPIC